MLTESCPKVSYRFTCKSCDYLTDKKSSYDKHLLTSKHIKLTNVNTFSNKSCSKITDTNKIFNCKLCDKEFTSRVGLWKHNKKCEISQFNVIDNDNNLISNNNEINNLTHLICELVKSNTDIHKSVIELCKNGTSNNIVNSNNVNSNNKTFNLQVFLNETCKDAMNMTDFLGNFEVQLEEIEYIGNHGYVIGMTKMIMDRLKDMDITKRPIHCTDIKRETMYIKDKNEWSKDTDDLTKLRRILNYITMKNYKTVPKWKTAHPDCEEVDTRDYNFCYNMMQMILGDVEEEQVKLDNKIIKTLAKNLFCKSNE